MIKITRKRLKMEPLFKEEKITKQRFKTEPLLKKEILPRNQNFKIFSFVTKMLMAKSKIEVNQKKEATLLSEHRKTSSKKYNLSMNLYSLF